MKICMTDCLGRKISGRLQGINTIFCGLYEPITQAKGFI
jgi:hypothetical protein